MMNLKSFLESRQGEDIHLRLTNSAEIEGRLVAVGDDIVGLENAAGTTMIVPFNAIAFTRSSTKAVRELAGQV